MGSNESQDQSQVSRQEGVVGERVWVSLQGLWTEKGPVLGALVDQDGGPVLYLDPETALVKRCEGKVFSAEQPPQAVATYYAIANRSGQVGRGRYSSLLEAGLQIQQKGDPDSYSVVAVENQEPRVLTDEERTYIRSYQLPGA